MIWFWFRLVAYMLCVSAGLHDLLEHTFNALCLIGAGGFGLADMHHRWKNGRPS